MLQVLPPKTITQNPHLLCCVTVQNLTILPFLFVFRTYTTDKNYETLLEKLKSHHSNVIRTVGHTTNTVMKLSDQMSHDVKTLYTNHPATEKIDNIILSLQVSGKTDNYSK